MKSKKERNQLHSLVTAQRGYIFFVNARQKSPSKPSGFDGDFFFIQLFGRLSRKFQQISNRQDLSVNNVAVTSTLKPRQWNPPYPASPSRESENRYWRWWKCHCGPTSPGYPGYPARRCGARWLRYDATRESECMAGRSSGSSVESAWRPHWVSAEFRPGLRIHIRCPHRQPQETLFLPAGASVRLSGIPT